MRRQVRIIQCLSAVAAVLMLGAIAALAATPALISIQGKLADAGGVPPTPGVKSFVFRIFNASSLGTQIWPTVGGEAQNISTNADGLWTGQLGAVNSITDVVFADTVRWLEITVNGELLSPRVRLVTGAYAMRAATVDGATGGKISGVLHVDGPGGMLLLQGDGVGNAAGAYLTFYDGAGGTLGWLGDGRSTDQDMYLTSSVGNVKLATAGGTALTVDAGGNVGIGTEPGSSRLTVTSSSTLDALTGFSSSFLASSLVGIADAGRAIWGISLGGGQAGQFNGRVDIFGTLTKDAGSFKIDHPLDPVNKYLSHSFVESPDMMNIYNGNVTLDANGEASVELPEWFGALNKDFRYQLTCIGGFAQVYVAEKVKENRFRIAGGTPGLEVSWQVTGIRQDAYANAYRIPVEELKPRAERGFYRNPELFSQPEEKQIEWARRPEMMKQMKNEREKANSESQE